MVQTRKLDTLKYLFVVDPKIKKRSAIVNEIFGTELFYVEHLQIAIKVRTVQLVLTKLERLIKFRDI